MFNVPCYLLINGQPIRMISKWKSHQKYMIRQMAFTAFPYIIFFSNIRLISVSGLYFTIFERI